IAANISKMNENNSVMIFSLEMSFQELVFRMLASESRIDMQKLRKGQLRTSSVKEEDEWDRLVKAAGSLSRMKILIDDTPAISLNEIRAKARRVKTKYGIKTLFIDHLQLITTVDSNKMIVNRNNEISYISRSLKALAKELGIPI